MKKKFSTYETLCKLPLGRSLWGLLFFIIFLLSCTNDVADVETSSQQEHRVTVRMNIPGMQSTISRAGEDNITSITALAYNSDNKLTKIVSATDLNTEEHTFNITVPNGTKNIHFLANNTVSLPEIGTDVSALTSLTTSDYNNLVYWGMATTSDGNTNPLSVTLYRNLAKISIKPSEAADAFNDYTQEQLIIMGLMNANRNGKLIPYNDGSFYSNQNGTAPDYLTLPDNPNPLDKTPVGNNGAGYGYSLYVLEHDNPKDWDTGLYVICKIGGAYYKVALVGEDGEPYDIIRNHEYIIYVSDVDDYAYDSDYRAEIYSDAFDKKPINLDVEEVEYETVEVSMAASTNTLDYNTTSISNLVLSVTVPPEVNTLTLNTPGFTVATFSDTNLPDTETKYLVKKDDGSFTVNHPENDEEHTFSFRLTLKDYSQQSYELSCTAASNDANVQIAQPESVAVSLNKVGDDANVYWMGASPLDYFNSPSKIPISAAKLTKGATVTFEYVKGEGNADIGLQHAGWKDFDNEPTLDLSQNTTSFKITQELYNEIQSNKGWIYEVADAGMVIQGQNITLTKITIDPTEDVALTVDPTTASLYYDSDNTQQITVTVPEGKTLTQLTITPRVDCFTITPTTDLSGPVDGVYTYAPEGGVTGSVTFTIAPKSGFVFTNVSSSTLTFGGTGVDMNVSTAQTEVTLAAKPAIIAYADKATLYYDTDNQTTTVTVNIPKGVSALSITATDFTVTQYNNSVGNYDNGTYTLNNTYSEQTVQFVFTMNNVSSTSDKTSTTIVFSDNSGVATSPDPITISLTEKPEDVTSLVVTPVGNNTINFDNNEDSVKFILTKPADVSQLTISGASAFDITVSPSVNSWGSGSDQFSCNNLNGITELTFTFKLRSNYFKTNGSYTITFSDTSQSVSSNIISTKTVDSGVICVEERELNDSQATILPYGAISDYLSKKMYIEVRSSDNDSHKQVIISIPGMDNKVIGSNEPINSPIEITLPDKLSGDISFTGHNTTITKIYFLNN